VHALDAPPDMTATPSRLERDTPTLRGWRLAVARVAWAGVTLAATALYIIAIPSRYAQLLAPCAAGACAPGQFVASASPASEAALAPSVYASWLIGLDVAFAMAYVGMAWLIFWRKASDREALFVALMLAMWGLTFTGVMNALDQRGAVWLVAVASASFLGAALITLFFYTFPDGRFAPRWAGWLALVWIGSQVPKYFLPDLATLNPDRWPQWLNIPVSAGFLSVMVALQVYRYRWVSGAAQRRQTKWVALGIGLSLGGYTTALLAGYILTPATGSAGYLLYVAAMNACLLLIPLSIAIAVARDGLYDIDLLINRSLVYGSLSAALIAFYAGSVYLLSWLARGLVDLQNSSLAVALSTLGVVALFQPLRTGIQRAIDRRFYRRRYNAARVLEAFGETLQREVELARLAEQLVDIVARTMEPSHISLMLLPPHWEREPERRAAPVKAPASHATGDVE
jgi:hypothetical protein